LSDERLKLAVFIDFDNIEIGVKTTLGVHFDIGAILEAIKERGEVITKVAYGDWKRAGDHSRLLTQHAIRMVQRNVTPGGDKNGADINLALDALEMALTHDHINAYVIVGGDSDFISLVEKLKQYDKKVFVVGGRAFTSIIMQKNCYEFIAYENLIAPPPATRRTAAPEKDRARDARLSKAVPLVARALQVLSDREVSPQLGLLKSTLLQLDSAFSERDYGVSSFREFVEKLAQAGHVNLKQTGRSLLVELNEGDGKAAPELPDVTPAADGDGNQLAVQPAAAAPAAVVAPAPAVAAATPQTAEPEQQPAASAAQATSTPIEGIQTVRRMFESGFGRVRWPMYVRNVKQFVRSMDAAFDERRYGFGGILDLLRGCQREGIFRLERDRQGVLRVFPGPVLQKAAGEPAAAPAGAEPVVPDAVTSDEKTPAIVEADVVAEAVTTGVPEPGDATVLGTISVAPPTPSEVREPMEEPGADEEQPPGLAPARSRRRRSTGVRKTAGGTTRGAKTRATTTRPRGRKRSE
jgi:uncharacterized LabA/DUF88 family protein